MATEPKTKTYKVNSLVSIDGGDPVGPGERVTTDQYAPRTLTDLAKGGVLEEVKEPEPPTVEDVTPVKAAGDKTPAS